ncbi:MAG: hypothetical protein OEL66_04435 [Desulfobulbaceae bacterium]|nr:hypothetical protein [Desulfobulbaceae bacterium]
MKKAVVVAMVLGLFLFAGKSYAEMWPGMMGGYGMGGEMMGGYGMGPGMMGGYGMGPGMMGGYGMGPGMMRGYGMGPGMMRGHGMGYGRGYGRMYGLDSGISPEAYKKFMDETVSLRKEIHDKMFTFFEAERNPKTSRNNLFKMEKELYELRQQLHEKAWEAFHE